MTSQIFLGFSKHFEDQSDYMKEMGASSYHPYFTPILLIAKCNKSFACYSFSQFVLIFTRAVSRRAIQPSEDLSSGGFMIVLISFRWWTLSVQNRRRWRDKERKIIDLIDWLIDSLIDCFSWSSVLPSFSSALVKARLTHLAGSVIWHLTFTGCIAYYANGYQWCVGSPVNVCCSDRIPINLSMAITSLLPHSCSSISLISSRGSSG